MALNQQDIDVGAAPNDGLGDPIRTAFIKCNDNFTQLYSLPNPTPPATLIGTAGDMPGMYAYDNTYFYYCYAPYNGVSTVWGQLVQSDEAIHSIGNGLSNVVIAFANANITVGVNGTGNVGVFSPSGLEIKGAFKSNTITTGSLVSGNFTVAGDTISSLGDTITITPAGNVIYGDVVVNAGFSILGNTTTTEAPVIVLANTAANTTAANGSGIQVSQSNFASVIYHASSNRWIAKPQLETANLYINSPTNNGNISGAYNINASNTITGNTINGTNITASNTITGNTINGTNINVTNITASNTITGNTITGTSISANTLSGDGGFISNIRGAIVTGTVANAAYSLLGNAAVYSTYANVANTVNDAAQPNITSVGTLTSLTVIGNTQLGNISSTGNISAQGLITAPAMGTPLTTIIQGKIGVASNSQPNITALGTITDFYAGHISASGDAVIQGNLYAGNILGTIVATTKFAEYVTSNAQPNITSVGILNNLGLDGNAIIYGANVILANVIGTSGTATRLRGTLGAGSNAQPNVTSVGNLISLNVDGQAKFGTTAANTVTISGNTISSGTAGTTLNLGYNVIVPGNVTATYFNGTATSAQYADLAENYLADAKYLPGTVVSFGGPKEVTVSTQDLDVLVAGVISTDPAYLMNSGLAGDYKAPVALMGRVPCRVTGSVTRGAMMVSNGDGTARAEQNPVMGSVIGKALESFDGSVGIIEIVVGKL